MLNYTLCTLNMTILTWARKSSKAHISPISFHSFLYQKRSFLLGFSISNYSSPTGASWRLQATLSSIGLCLYHSGVCFNIISYFLQSVWKTWVTPQARHFLWCSWRFYRDMGNKCLERVIRKLRGHPSWSPAVCGSWEENNHPLIKWHGKISYGTRKEVKKKVWGNTLWRKVWTLKHSRLSSGCCGRVYVKGLKG